MNVKLMRVSDRTWLSGANAQTNCFKSGEAAELLWDALPEVNYPTGKSVAEFKPNLWNNDKLGALCKDLVKVEYGIA